MSMRHQVDTYSVKNVVKDSQTVEDHEKEALPNVALTHSQTSVEHWGTAKENIILLEQPDQNCNLQQASYISVR